ncbi:MAG TPA: hypothetical protein VIF84_11355, partial [Candidatus Limnocylindrales bacterium]
LETYREGWNWAVQGIPVATAVSLAAIAIGIVTFLIRHRPRSPEPTPETAETEPDAGTVEPPAAPVAPEPDTPTSG